MVPNNLESALKWIEETKVVKKEQPVAEDVKTTILQFAPPPTQPVQNTEVTVVLPNSEPASSRVAKLTKEYVVDCLKAYALEEQERKASWTKKNLSISEDLAGCIRKTFFAFMGVPPEANYTYPYSEIVTSIGDTVHEILQKRIPCLKTEEKLYVKGVFPVDISMRCDMILTEHNIIEFKTIDSLPANPKPEHALQAIFYAYFFRKVNNMPIDIVQIVYVSRGKIDVKVFDVNITDTLINETEKWLNDYMSELKKYLDERVPPALNNRFVNKTSCFFCEFKKECNSPKRYEQLSR